MANTTLRLPEELKKRVAETARRTGKSPHALMVEAIAEIIEATEARLDFIAEAEARDAEMVASGTGLEWEDVREYLREKAAGRPATAPRRRPWRG